MQLVYTTSSNREGCATFLQQQNYNKHRNERMTIVVLYMHKTNVSTPLQVRKVCFGIRKSLPLSLNKIGRGGGAYTLECQQCQYIYHTTGKMALPTKPAY